MILSSGETYSRSGVHTCSQMNSHIREERNNECLFVTDDEDLSYSLYMFLVMMISGSFEKERLV